MGLLCDDEFEDELELLDELFDELLDVSEGVLLERPFESK